MNRINVKPARPGLTVLDPATYRPLPAEGAEVLHNAYWRRRLAVGDVVTTGGKAPTPASSPAKRPRPPSSPE